MWCASDESSKPQVKNALCCRANREEHYKCLEIFKEKRINQVCRLLKDNKPVARSSYYLISGKPVTGPFPAEDCDIFDPDKLQIKEVQKEKSRVFPEGGEWYVIKDAEPLYLLGRFQRKAEAEGFLAAARKNGFTHHCRVRFAKGQTSMSPGIDLLRRGDPAEMELLAVGKAKPYLFEDCSSFKFEDLVKVGPCMRDEGRGAFGVCCGSKDKPDETCLERVRKYGYNQICNVGSFFNYYLTSGKPAAGPLPGEECEGRFSADNLQLELTNNFDRHGSFSHAGRVWYYLYDDFAEHAWLVKDTRSNVTVNWFPIVYKAQAQAVIGIIQKYGFTRWCNQPPYLRKSLPGVEEN